MENLYLQTNHLTPKEIVKQLDEFIIGQNNAKKSVAIAIRNRIRRMKLKNEPIFEEIYPKNIIMIGPTGVGKTEIARRLAKLVEAPFIKVEATKYTEVGYVGRDVESMVRDLVQNAIKMVRAEHEEKLKKKLNKNVEEKIVEYLILGGSSSKKNKPNLDTEEEKQLQSLFLKKLRNGDLEEKEIEIQINTPSQPFMQVMPMSNMEDLESQMKNMLGDMLNKKKTRKKFKIKDARKFIKEEELENLLDVDKIKLEAIDRTEQGGIIFIDEIDKIASNQQRGSADISREGVQRDFLPLVEGSNVQTKYGMVKTDHILFVAAGAFHISSVSDLIPELQGRFPIRVELHDLTIDDYIKILKNPKNALTKQYQALLSTEDIAIKFDNSSFKKLAEVTMEMNTKNENIGARRLYTIIEKLLEDISFNMEKYKNKEIIIDDKYISNQLKDIIDDEDLSRYIL